MDEGLTKAETSRRLGINQNSLGKWVRAYRDQRENAFPGKGRQRPEQEELRRLREENRQLRMEREILNDGLLRKGNTMRFHRGGEGQLSGQGFVPRIEGPAVRTEWLGDRHQRVAPDVVVRIFEKNKRVYGARPISKALPALGFGEWSLQSPLVDDKG